MYPKLEELCSLYTKYKDYNNYIYDDVYTIMYDYKDIDNITLNIKLIKVDNQYMIFIYIDDIDKLSFNGLLEESDKDLTKSYELLKEDLRYLSFENFIDKYYERLKNNIKNN